MHTTNQPARQGPPPPLIALKEAAACLGVCSKTFAKYVDEGRLPVVLLPSGIRRFRRSDLEEFVAARLLPATPGGFARPARRRQRCAESEVGARTTAATRELGVAS